MNSEQIESLHRMARRMAREIMLIVVAKGGQCTRGEIGEVFRQSLQPGWFYTVGEVSAGLEVLRNAGRVSVTPQPYFDSSATEIKVESSVS